MTLEEKLKKAEEKIVILENMMEERSRALYNTNRDLQRANTELEHFVYMASHDLQEPLRNIAGFSDLLVTRYKDKLDEDGGQFLAFIIDGVRRMETLINDLLAYMKVGRDHQAFCLTDSTIVLMKTLSYLDAAIGNAHAIITYDALPSVMGDLTQLETLFQNLISNAIKYRKGISPRIHVGVTEATDEWVFFVKDDGIGLDLQYKDKIFEVFRRLHPLGKYPGTGIGLAICKKIVDLHGGRIWVQSVPGQGATFYFTIPKRR